MSFKVGDRVRCSCSSCLEVNAPSRATVLRVEPGRYRIEWDGGSANSWPEENLMLDIPPPDPDVKHMVDEYLRETA